MCMKILYVTTISGTMPFFEGIIKELIKDGNTVDIACGDTKSQYCDTFRKLNCKIYELDTSRNPLNFNTIRSIGLIKEIVKNGKYDVVHCHTPIISVCTRIACKAYRKKGLKVIYTAHGFHFFKGASIKNWILYFPIEWLCSFWTDILITINKEDFRRAKRILHAKRTLYVPGVGIDLDDFGESCNGDYIREEFNIPENATLLLSVGDLNKNKNHKAVVKAISYLNIDNLYYIIVGSGDNNELNSVIEELELQNRVKLAGYRDDVRNIMKAANFYVHPSFREGLSVSIMEAMASGLPCAVSRIRGNVDLINEYGGVLFEPSDLQDITDKLYSIIMSREIYKKMGIYNQEKAKKYDKKNINKKMFKIYHSIDRNN